MKNKILISIISIAFAVFFLVSCANESYTDTKTAKEVNSAIESSIKTEKGVKILDDDAILNISDSEIPYLKDYIFIKANDSSDLNEYGIFRVEDGKADDMKALLENYVKSKQEMYRAYEYFPAETAKVDNATVSVFGNYVVYSFLNEADTEAFHNAIKECIKK